MKNRKHKIYYSSYRKQLIQLAKLYGIVEIKNYFRSAKKLTTAQIELILIKNRIKLPIQRSLSRFKFTWHLNHLQFASSSICQLINESISKVSDPFDCFKSACATMVMK